MSFVLLQRIRFALCHVRSLLLAASQLISFPAGTKTLQSPALSIITDLLIKEWKSYSAILGSQAACAYPRHIAAGHGLLQHSSQVFPLIV